MQGRVPPDSATANSTETEAVALISKRPVDEPPRLIGGLASLQRAVTYPEQAKALRLEGRVLVRCIVSKEGKPSGITVTRSVHRLLDEEAVRAMRRMRFKPAMKNGKPVEVFMTLPVTFRLR
jgi:protein TonB